MDEAIRIDVLGELRVFAPDGERITLPASRKARALLAYLALTRRQQFREHLCDLLWDGSNDPRGALRWCLSRLRAGLDSDSKRRISSDRRTVGVIPNAVTIDFLEATELMRAPEQPSLDALRRVASLFRGDLLEGLDLLDCFRFHAWCAGEREAARSLRRTVLSSLIDRAPNVAEALKYAHALVSIDPLDEAANMQVIRLLMQMQRDNDAQQQADAYRRTLEIELGEVPEDVATRLRRIVHIEEHVPRRAVAAQKRAPRIDVLPFVGREQELATLGRWLTTPTSALPLAIIAGEPGAGKTRLMNEAVDRLGGGRQVIHARAFRAENARAFGPWRDALADVEGTSDVLTSAHETEQPQEREHLFDELRAFIRQAATTRPLLIALDDVQWLDEASAAFMHFLVRSDCENVALLTTMRSEEVVDNPAVGEMVDSLRGADMALDLELAPLTQADVGEICSAIDDAIDAEQVFARSDGNPFHATEIARAIARGETELPSNIRHLISTRLQALSESARELLPWAAALGRTFHIDVLERVTGLGALALLERVGELEERGIFEPRATGAYDFVHDLVRDAAYRELSIPRQRIIHRSIARSIDSWPGAADRFGATGLLRHAELGGEAAIACKASVAAAREALHLCAWLDSVNRADRGLQHVASLDVEHRVATTLDLLNYRITAGAVLDRQHPDNIATLLADIMTMGTPKQHARALYLHSLMQYDHGEVQRAERTLLDAVDAGRRADPETEARQLANTARCLLHIEGDVPKARTLLVEARNALRALALQDVELFWAEALLARWDGDLDQSADYLLKAILLAKQTDQHWRQSSCLAGLIMVAFEAGDPGRVEELARGGLIYEEETGEPLKSPFVEGLAALADLSRDANATARLNSVAEVLRARGAKAQLSYVLAEAARIHADIGNLDEAHAAATDAAALGASVSRVVPHTDALVTIAWVCHELGDDRGGLDALGQAEELARDGQSVTARVRARLERVADVLRGTSAL